MLDQRVEETPEPIGPAELDTAAFDQAEAVIEGGRVTFLEVGRAITAIRDGGKVEMRRRGYADFADYMSRRWGWTRDYGYKMIRAVTVAENVESILQGAPLGIMHTTVLSPLTAPEQRHVWTEAVRTSADGRPRLGDLRRIVRAMDAERQAAQKAERLAAPPVARPTPPPARGARVEVADATALPLIDGSVDLICTSPPYSLAKPYDIGGDVAADEWPRFMEDWLREAYRVAKPGGRLAINIPLDVTRPWQRPTYSTAVTAAVAAGWQYRFSVVWDEDSVSKTVARGSIDSAGAPHVIARAEMIPVLYKGVWKREQGEWPSDLEHEEWLAWTDGVWEFQGESRSWEGHPAPFPEELPRRLIKLLSFPGDTVLDPFAGSGTTVLVARRLGRKAIGFDVSLAYVDSTLRRLAAEEETDDRSGR